MTAHELYHTYRWKQVRKFVLARDQYRCQICGQPANAVDHIVSWREAPQRAFDANNLRAICKSHNSILANRRRAALARWARAQLSGQPQPEPSAGSRAARRPGSRFQPDPNQRQW